MTTEDLEMRRLLWLRHGCPVKALYGDDGEMQCGLCLVDFLHDTPEDMEAKFKKNNWKAPMVKLERSFPLVLFFETKEAAEDFIALVQEAQPNLKGETLA